jgi:hypothetical protein
MLDGDSRSDSQADDDWTQANTRLFGSSVDNGVSAMVRNAARPVVTLASVTALASSASSFPVAQFDVASAYVSADIRSSFSASPGPHLNTKTLRRILAARETIFKHGIYLPRSDHDADTSPESARWKSGRQLEWLRLKAVGAFEYDWTISRMNLEHPEYQVDDIGRVFFIYDYKFSGEHRVRLVFDGSRQSPHTYKDTYSPTVRAESIRIFHVYSVEMDWDIRQFDVPQAFLQSPSDHTIFVYPPRTHVERPGQILKLRLALYGAKQSSALFYKLLNEFLLGLGFVPSSFDPCFYKRHDALIIVHVDDMRVSASPDVLTTLHFALFERFRITTGDGSRFLGMDVTYDRDAGILRMGMQTYIQSTLDRFTAFDTSLGVPYREIVGCLLWIVLCVVGPELVKVKELARHSNSPTLLHYQSALKTLKKFGDIVRWPSFIAEVALALSSSLLIFVLTVLIPLMFPSHPMPPLLLVLLALLNLWTLFLNPIYLLILLRSYHSWASHLILLLLHPSSVSLISFLVMMPLTTFQKLTSRSTQFSFQSCGVHGCLFCCWT